jgi:hypothetical protein
MRTKQPIRSKRDHFMYLDCLESNYLEPTPVLIKTKQANEALLKSKLVDLLGHEPASPTRSPTTIFAPMSTPPPMTLPPTVDKPSLPETSVWGSAAPMLKRVWSSSREEEVMDEWLDELTLQKRAKMILKGASAWPQKDCEAKTKHRRLHAKFWAKKREQKKSVLQRVVLAEHDDELARGGDPTLPVAAVSQKTLYLLQKAGARKLPRENGLRRAKTRRDKRRASSSARCFAFDDPEQAGWPTHLDEVEGAAKSAAATATAVRYDLNLAFALLRREPTGPALAELFTRGVPLSFDATKDLKNLLKLQPQPKSKATVKPLPLQAREDTPHPKVKTRAAHPKGPRGKRGC